MARAPLTDRQKAALAAGRAKKRQSQTREETLAGLDDRIAEEGLDQPVRDKPARPKARAKPEVWVTPEAAALGGAVVNWLFVRTGGEDAALTVDEARGIAAPLMRIGARRLAKLLARFFPDGMASLAEGDARDVGASITSLVKYVIRRVGNAMIAFEQSRQQKQEAAPVAAPPPVGMPEMEDLTSTEPAAAPAQPRGNNFPLGVFPRDMGAIYGS